MARRTEIEVRGLREFRKELKGLGGTLPKDLAKANKRAVEVITSVAKAKAMAMGGVQAKAAPSIKAAATQRVAKLTIGDPRRPFAIGAYTGAKRWPQFPEWDGPEIEEGAGYAVGPAIISEEGRFMAAYEQELDRLAAKAFPSTLARLRSSLGR